MLFGKLSEKIGILLELDGKKLHMIIKYNQNDFHVIVISIRLTLFCIFRSVSYSKKSKLLELDSKKLSIITKSHKNLYDLIMNRGDFL